MPSADLQLGAVYFVLAYEDDDFSRPIIQSHEYLGRRSSQANQNFLFRFLGSKDELELSESQLDIVLDLTGLIDALEDFRLGRQPR